MLPRQLMASMAYNHAQEVTHLLAALLHGCRGMRLVL